MKKLSLISLLIVIAALVVLQPARSEKSAPDEYLGHRLASGERIKYIWKDTINQPWLGKVEVLGCAGGSIRVRNSWLNQIHEYTLYSGDWHNENVQEPRVEWFATCNVYVRTNIALFGKQVARLIFIPLAPHSDQVMPPH